MNQDALLDLVRSVSTILAGALLFWLVFSRAMRRARWRYETQLTLATQSLDPESELMSVQRKLTALRLVVNATRYILALVVLLMVLNQFTPNAASLIFPAGFLAAALGLGGQNLVRDIVAGLFIIFENQFAVGDVVSINGTLGTVEEVGLRVTRLRDDSGQLYYFPNGAINTVSKFPHRTTALMFWVPVPGGTNHEHATAVVEYVLEAVNELLPGTLTELQPMKWRNEPPLHTSQVDGSGDVETGRASGTVEDEKALEAGVEWLCWRFLANPARATLLREKLPGRLSLALRNAGIATPNGAVTEIVTAPVYRAANSEGRFSDGG
jgi:small-conductance mechanosensitive channel